MEARSPFRFYNAYLARKPCESHCVSLPTAGAWGSGASNTTLALGGCMAFTARPAPALRVSQLCTLADLIVPAFNPSPFSLQYTRPPPLAPSTRARVCRAAAGSRRLPRQSSGVASLWGWGCARSGRHRASCRRGCLPNRTDELAAAVQAAKSSEGRMAGEPPMNELRQAHRRTKGSSRVGQCPATGSTTTCSGCQPCIHSRYCARVALSVQHGCGAHMQPCRNS